MAGNLTETRLPVRVLLTAGVHDYHETVKPLLRSLDATQHFQITTVSSVDALLAGRLAMVASDQPLAQGEARALTEFVRGGGGLVLLHSTLAAWSSDGELAELTGWTPSGPGPVTELVVKSSGDHPISASLGPEMKLTDELYLAEGPPIDANVFLTCNWQFTHQVVAYDRKVGQGTVVYLGLGHSATTFESATVQKVIHRSLLFAGGRTDVPTVGIGLIGYGAIARAHASAIGATPGLRLGGVCDVSSARREVAEREWNIKTHATAAALFDDPNVDMVVVGTPPNVHAESVLAALAAGKHVVCEKPFALRVEDVDRMVDAAERGGRVLTVYQSRRWDPDFVALRDAVRSGAIGDPFYMESFIGGYSHPCDYWHSHEPISGGTIYDWGSHYFDWLLQLFPGMVTAVSAVAHKRVWHDVTNSDQVRVDLTFEGGAQANFLQSDIAAALKPKWYILGTRGAVTGEWQYATAQSRNATGEVIEEHLAPADSPARVKIHRPSENGPSHEETLSLARREEHGFYRNLADHLIWSEPLAVPAAEARRNVAVMETAAQSIARGGERLEVRI